MRAADPQELRARFVRTRRRTVALVEPLAAEDMVVQSMPDVSPTKWHLAHVTWWFERFLLEEHAPGYEAYDARFAELFNSYYVTAGTPWTRARRGLLSRPTVDEVLAFRRAIDGAVDGLLAGDAVDARIAFLVELGLAHEEQHQELLLMDIEHVFSLNPLAPCYREAARSERSAPGDVAWIGFGGGVREVGAPVGGVGFAFDNETPRHEVLLRDFELADRAVTNGEFRAFVEDGGYARPELWLSDGWDWLRRESIDAPAYWRRRDHEWDEFTLSGLRPLADAEPVVHVSYYEADAFARWAGARLPTEHEWEVAAGGASPAAGNFADVGPLHPQPAAPGPGLRQLYGDVWEWTASPYGAYPGFRPLEGTLGEYNGKFMSSQLVLRGGSCATPAGHVRATYRNFFYPHQRWQFAGLRLARDP